MFNLFKLIANEFRALVFPGTCLKCRTLLTGKGESSLSSCYCTGCLGNELPHYIPPFCPCCGKVFASRTGESHLCEDCLKRPPVVSRVRAAFEYKGVVREGIGQFKYNSRLSLARPFESCLFHAFGIYLAGKKIDLIVPIPLYFKKARQRGFNQSYLLVRNFASLYREKYGIPPGWTIDAKGLVRVKQTSTQTGLDIVERRKNLKQAFKWKGRESLEGKSVLLVDDVYTTGATCDAAAGALTDAGADRVDALVLARA